MADTTKKEGPATLKERVNHLFAAVPSPRGGKYTNHEVVEALQELGISCSVGYVSNLRLGKSTNPTLAILDGLAKVFGVSVSYFFDDEAYEQSKRELARLVAARAVRDALADPLRRQLMIRSRDLNDEGLMHVVEYVNGLLTQPANQRRRER